MTTSSETNALLDDSNPIIGQPTDIMPDGKEDLPYFISTDSLLNGFIDSSNGTLRISQLSVDHGQLTIVSSSQGWILIPESNYDQWVTLSYTVTNGTNELTNQQQSFQLVPVNDAPYSISGDKGSVLSIPENTDGSYTLYEDDLLSDFADVDSSVLSVINLTAQNGTLTEKDSNSWSFVPKADFDGRIALTYLVSDQIASTPARSTFALNLAPVFGELPKISYVDTVVDDTFAEFTGTLQATDPNGDAVRYGVEGGVTEEDGLLHKVGSYGELKLNPETGAFSFLPNDLAIELLGFNAVQGFTLRATDGNKTSEVSLTVNIRQEGTTESLYDDSLQGTAASDSMNGFAGNDTIDGSTGNDSVNGLSGNDRLSGGVGHDQLTGGTGDDLLEGAAGNDSLAGGLGDDVLYGGLGKDSLFGGSGDDVFLWQNIGETATTDTRDLIEDFKSGQDKIDLSGIDANANKRGDQAFALEKGSQFVEFSSVATLYFETTTGILYGNTDTDKAADFSLQLTGVNTLTTTDFLL